MTGYLKQYPTPLQLVTFIGLFIGFMVLYLLFLATGFTAISGYSLETLQGGNLSDPKVIAYLKLTQFLYTLIVYLVPAAIFAYLTDPQPVTWMGLQRSPRLLPAILAILIMLCAVPAVDITSDWNNSWPLPESARQLEEQATRLTRALLNMPDFGSLLVNLLVIALLPAVAEEFFFRGVLQRLFMQLMPRLPWLAVIITAILFSAIHLQWMDFVPRVLLGFLLGAIYYLSGNLWLSILGHFLNNGFTVVLMFLYQFRIIHEDPMKSSATPWYAALISLLITIVLLRVFSKKAAPAPPKAEEELPFP